LLRSIFAFQQTLIQKFSRRTYEGSSLLVFLVARLFLDHDDRDLCLLYLGPSLQLPEHRLRCISIDRNPDSAEQLPAKQAVFGRRAQMGPHFVPHLQA
jgi:hypothetical protein